MSVPESVTKYLRGVRHVGIVTRDSDALVSRLQQIFAIPEADILRVPTPDTKFVFLDIGGMPYEIIEPVSQRFKDILLDRGHSNVGVNHVCYNVEDIEGAVAAMKAAGVRPGHVSPDGIIEAPKSRMVYFNPEDTAGILLEFVEPRS